MAVLCGSSQRLCKCLLLTRSSSVTRALTISVRKGYSSLKNCVWNFQSGTQSATRRRPVAWPSRSSELLLTAPPRSWWETRTNGRTTRAGSCGWLPAKDAVFHNSFNSDILLNKSWSMFHLTQWRKSDGMTVCMLLYKNASLNLKNEFQLENWNGASLVTQLVKNPPALQETPLWFLGQEVPLEKGQATHPVFLGFPSDSAGRESTCNAGDLGLIPVLGRSPGEGDSYPLQYPGLEISMDYIVHGVAKSWTRLSDFHFHFQSETRGKHIISRWPRCCLFESELGNLFLSDFLMSPQKGLLPLWVSVSGGDAWGQTSGVPSSLPCAQTLRCIFLRHWAPSALLSLWFKWVSPGAASSALSFMWKKPLPGNLLISLLMSWMQCVNPFSHQLLSNFHE